MLGGARVAGARSYSISKVLFMDKAVHDLSCLNNRTSGIINSV